MTTKIWRVTLGDNLVSRDVVARNVKSAMSKAKRLIISQARKEGRDADVNFYSKAPVTTVDMIARSDD
jgi:hypothetical protein